MSFGTSVGDVLKVGELAYRLWRACSTASPEFKELRRELGSVEITLRSLGDDANDPSSLICRRGASRYGEVMQIIDNLKAALLDVEKLVSKYQSLGLVKKRTFDRVKFATHDLGDLRQKISVHLAALTSFYNGLSASSLARIEAVLEDIYQDVRNGDREPTIISMCNSPADENAWDLLKKELAAEDVAVSEVERYRAEIVSFLKELILKDPEGIEPSDSISNDPVTQQLAFADLLTVEKLRQNDFDIDNEDLRDAELESALLWASSQGHIDVVRFLIRQDINIEACDRHGMTAMHKAVRAGHTDVVEALIKAGASTTACRRHRLQVKGLFSQTCLVQYNVIMDAAERGRTALVKLLLNSGASLDSVEQSGVTPLHVAITNGHHSTVSALLDAGASVEKQSSSYQNRNAIYLAAELGYLSMVKYLIKRGADVSKSCQKRGSILSAVLQAGIETDQKEKICRFLLDSGARARAIVRENEDIPAAPLQIAIQQNNFSLVEMLISRGADPNQIDASGSSPLCTALEIAVDPSTSSRTSIIKHLVEAGAKVTESSHKSRIVNPVNLAIAYHDLLMVKYLLDQGASADFCDDHGTTPVCCAIKQDVDEETRASMVKCLVASGTSLNESKVENKIVPALHFAIKYARKNLVAYLLTSGASSELVDDEGKTILLQAINLGFARYSNSRFLLSEPIKRSANMYDDQLAIVDCLLSQPRANATPDQVSKDKVNALHLAIEQGQFDVVKQLIAKGADVTVNDSKGTSTILKAVQATVTDEAVLSTVSQLLKAGANINASTSNYFLTPLLIAALNGKVSLVKVLLQHGADPNAIDYWKSNALHLAASKNSVECVKILLLAGTNPKQLSTVDKVSFYPLDVAILRGDEEIIALLDKTSPRSKLEAEWCYISKNLRVRTYEERRDKAIRYFGSPYG